MPSLLDVGATTENAASPNVFSGTEKSVTTGFTFSTTRLVETVPDIK